MDQAAASVHKFHRPTEEIQMKTSIRIYIQRKYYKKEKNIIEMSFGFFLFFLLSNFNSITNNKYNGIILIERHLSVFGSSVF